MFIFDFKSNSDNFIVQFTLLLRVFVHGSARKSLQIEDFIGKIKNFEIFKEIIKASEKKIRFEMR